MCLLSQSKVIFERNRNKIEWRPVAESPKMKKGLSRVKFFLVAEGLIFEGTGYAQKTSGMSSPRYSVEKVTATDITGSVTFDAN